MDLLRELEDKADDISFQSKWMAIKQSNKKRLVDWIKSR